MIYTHRIVFLCMAAIYARLSVDNDEKKSESIETQVTLIKEFIQKHNENPDKEYEIAVYDIYSDLGKTGTNFSSIPSAWASLSKLKSSESTSIPFSLKNVLRTS